MRETSKPMKPGGIGRLKPPTPVYRPCVLCGRKHRMRGNGTSKTGEVIKEEKVVMKAIGQYVRVPAGTVICLVYCPHQGAQRSPRASRAT